MESLIEWSLIINFLLLFRKDETMNMKFSAFCFLLFAFCLLPSASAQRFIGGIAAGMNFTQVVGDGVNGYHKVGFNGGPYVKLMVDKKQRFSVTMELLYSQKGAASRFIPKPIFGNEIVFSYPVAESARIDENYPNPKKGFYYFLRTDYLEIPVLFHYDEPRSKVSFGVGISWARLVYIREYLYDFGSKDSLTIGARRLNTTLNSGHFFKNDFGAILDVKIPIYKGLKFNFRFQYSMAPFGEKRKFYVNKRSDPNNPEEEFEYKKPFHNTLTFRIIYSINEKYTENTNYDKHGNRIGPKWIRDPEAMKW